MEEVPSPGCRPERRRCARSSPRWVLDLHFLESTLPSWKAGRWGEEERARATPTKKGSSDVGRLGGPERSLRGVRRDPRASRLARDARGKTGNSALP